MISLLQGSQAEIGTLRQFSRKQHFIVPAQTQWTHVQRLSPKDKEVSPNKPLEAGYRSKKQSSTHMAACDFIGYLILPVLCDLLHVSIL
jgi:hypothetical protein